MSVKNAVTVFFLVLFSLFFVKFFNLSYPLSVTSSNISSELSVVGEGKVDARPDTVNVDAGIVVNASPTVEEVQKSINDINNKIIGALDKLMIAKGDIKTTNYSIYPNYDQANHITGYNGNVTVSVKVRDIDKVSQVIEEMTRAGANQIQGTNYSIDKPEKFREEARNLAIQNAKEQAQKLANNLGIKLGRVVNIVESSGYGPLPMMNRYSSGMGGGGPDIEPGTQTITSTVTLYFEKR